MAAHPHMVAGTGRFCTRVMSAAGEAILVKTGAEGVFAAALPARGLGLALKIDDGATRASECATANLLMRLAPGAATEVLAGFADKPITNWAGLHVGDVRAASGWLD
jgi:L-asparaginase II